MNTKLLLIVVLFTCLQSVEESKRKGGRLKKAMKLTFGLLSLQHTSLSANTAKNSVAPPNTDVENIRLISNTSVPLSLPPNALSMIEYIHCSEPQDQFFDKYLTSADDQSGRVLKKVLRHLKKMGKCVSTASVDIIKRAKASIFGKKLSHEEQVGMFEDYLATFKNGGCGYAYDYRWREQLIDTFEKKKGMDFFRVKQGIDVFMRKHRESRIFCLLNRPDGQLLFNFQKFINDYQNYDFDRVEFVVERLRSFFGEVSPEDHIYIYEQALLPWIQHENLKNIEKIFINGENVPQKKAYWEAKARRFSKKNYDL